MFDTVKSSYNFGEEFKDTIFQTKTIEYEHSGLLNEYWLDPQGVLWLPDYTDTTYIEVESTPKFKIKRIPTGKKGRMRPHRITKVVEIYPATWSGVLDDWPRIDVDFVHGKIESYDIYTRSSK